MACVQTLDPLELKYRIPLSSVVHQSSSARQAETSLSRDILSDILFSLPHLTMSTQSGISVSDDLRTAFQLACESKDVLALKVVIDSGELGCTPLTELSEQAARANCTTRYAPSNLPESLIPSTSLPHTGSESEWDSIASMLGENVDVPAYVLVRLETSDWLLACYVPDKAAVRQKMLYSSTKATLQRQLGDSKFKQTMFASLPVRLSDARARAAPTYPPVGHSNTAADTVNSSHRTSSPPPDTAASFSTRPPPPR